MKTRMVGVVGMLVVGFVGSAVAAQPTTWSRIKALHGAEHAAAEQRAEPHRALALVAEQAGFSAWSGPVTVTTVRDGGLIVSGTDLTGVEHAYVFLEGRFLLGGSESFWDRLRNRITEQLCSASSAAIVAKCLASVSGPGSVMCLALGALLNQLCVEGLENIEEYNWESAIDDSITVTPPDTTGNGP